MADIFQEVDQAALEHRFRNALRRYGPFALGGLALVLVAVFVVQVMAGEAETRREEASARYAAALRDLGQGRAAEATAALDALAADDAGAYTFFAWLQKAEAALAAGDDEGATAAFRAAENVFDDRLYADLAALKSLYARFDTLTRQEVDLLATPLARDERPYWAGARELMAAAALREDALDQARREYEALARLPETPPGVRARAETALAIIAERQALARLHPDAAATQETAP